MVNKNSILNIIILTTYLLVSLLAIYPTMQQYVCILILFIIGYLSYKDKLYKIAPLFIFFNSSILYYEGIAIVDIYFFFYILEKLFRKSTIKKKSMHNMFIIFILYTVLVVFFNNSMLSLEIMLSLIFLLLFLNDILNRRVWHEFCYSYIITMLFAILYGVFNQYFMQNTDENIRFLMAFTDPNYAGMFLSIGLYITIFKKDIFSTIFRFFIIVICLIAIFATVSSTALLCNIIILLILLLDVLSSYEGIYILLTKYLIVFTVIVCILFYLQSLHIPLIDRTFERFIDKINMFSSGSIENATTGRSDVWKEHLNYFWNQNNIFHFLFGGNYLTDRGFDISKFSIVSHQVYIDSLLTFGIVGTIMYVISIIKQLFIKFIRRTENCDTKIIFIISLIWLIYSFGLSMFPFWGFIFFLYVNIESKEE